MTTVAVIPARYGSTRFPGKPLALIAGKPMIQWTYEKAAASKVDRVIVATDDEKIFACVKNFGGEVVMTRSDHPTGTDRIAEAVKEIDCDLIINLQGDEPLLPTEVIDELVDRMKNSPQVNMGTVAVRKSFDSEEYTNPNNVKVVLDKQQQALYFSRCSMPFSRNQPEEGDSIYLHWGIYAYRRQLLFDFITWPQGSLEKIESLEQLRVLEHGEKILVAISDRESVGVDTPEDVAKVEQLLKDQSQ
ncbi:3-deoxy-manno-octulosonate cytidylyltransferase [Lentisphaera araneosa HTCC2155]|uniref:3-deoxy-manno-octulosonate cytidylyltransferase n=1 Tax=Lentisphaera araneosa HTCC2155 TaxID=313628 RepID=A6DR45_9BACT|nr:3-deoxy-manno-octulosonate cytidylyltransferase [Lentisphaera araneosa]EDM25933.1 3-deoxy-manno-octulosonate cytidylyltransferase [Lentisphaera araneosa HTCC2155]